MLSDTETTQYNAIKRTTVNFHKKKKKKTYYAQSFCRNIAPQNCNLDSNSSSVQRSTSGDPSISTTGPILYSIKHKHLVVPLLLAVLVETLVEVLKNSVSKLFANWEEIKKGGRKAYLRKSDLGHDDGVHRAGSVPERLAGVTVRMVLVLVDLTVLIVGVPGHSALADADVALGVDRGGLAAEVPIIGGEEPAISLCILFRYVES